MTEANPTPVAPEPAAPANEPAPASAPEPKPEKQPPWGKPENFDPDKAWELIENLRKEKGGATDELKAQLDTLTAQQEAQKKALAEALGLAEPPKTEDDVTETVNALKARLDAADLKARRLEVAAEFKIPAEHHDLLTETDPEKLKAQAEKVGALVAAAATPGAPQNPAFVANPGQGQGGPTDPTAAEAAEYERFYPSTPNGK